jgi:hypothetical protein
MAQNINEHDMTKKMMDIIRGGYKKTLLKEEEVSVDASTIAPDTSQVTMAQSPSEGREPLIKLDNTYFEVPKDDQRYKDLTKKLQDIANVTVTSIYVSKNKDLVITGEALQYENSGLYFTMALSNKDVVTSTENVEGDEANIIINKLTGFLQNLRDDSAGTSEYLYDEKIDNK